MDANFDLVIRNGTLVDGSGEPAREADVAVKDGRIAELGKIGARGREEIDAKGRLVTPGFVDIHTHYDGQAIWSERLSPSSSHGVTSVVMGNCGVGFAPCRAGDRELLLSVMEGVEDIPEIVMAEGLTWEWESFPEYLAALERRPRDIDCAAQIPHSALRVFVMGQRGANREPATQADLEQMQRLVDEALDAGALGFATSRLFIHRTRDGSFIPSYEAGEAELTAIAQAMKRRGVLQFVLGVPGVGLEVELVARLARLSGRPASFSLAQDNANPNSWREVLARAAKGNDGGPPVRGQVFPRAVGLVLGHELSVNPFSLCPSYAALAKQPLAERIRALRTPEVRARLLEEQPDQARAPLAALGRNFERMFPLTEPFNYEPPLNQSVAALAREKNVSPLALAYDMLLEQDGRAMLYVALTNYAGGNLDGAYEMMTRNDTVLGLGDGGAHYGMICDSSYPTFILAHWTRDRKGKRLSVEEAVKKLARDPALTVGLSDRGLIARGKKADLNVIDYDGLTLPRPTVAFDLPAGGKRLTQTAKGYAATIVSGEVIQRGGAPTGALPGKLVRGAR